MDSACRKCGSRRLAHELRDSDMSNPPENAYGSWVVCLDCGREWRDLDPGEVAEKHGGLLGYLADK